MFSLFSQSFRMVACGIALAGLAWGQIPLDDGERAEAWENRKSVVWKIESARRALGMGLYDLAVLEADAVLEMRDSVDRGALEQVRLIKADALLASGEVGQASRIYTSLRGEDLADLRMLRRAMVDFSRRDVEAAQIKLAQVNLDLEKLRQSDVAWWSFLKGWVELRLGSIESAEGFFDTAGKAALESPALKAQLSYLEFRLKISNGAALDRDELEGAYNDAVGTEIGYEYAKQLAIVLAEEGELERAIALLELQLGNLPEAYREIRDGLLLSELTLATVNRVEGQDAAENLLMNGRSEALMRAGLQQLVSSSMGQGGDLEEFLRERLDAIIEVGAGHPLLDETYYYRGALNFFTGDFDAAEEDARRFEELFPESEYRRGVYALRASTAWRSHLYRTAASALSRLRNEYAERYESTALAALIADCYFRAGVQGNSAEDFRSAAGAYRDAIEPMSKGKEAGETFYQLVLSYLKSGDIEEARRMVDSPDLRAKASSRYLWRAEWMLLEAMRASVDFAHQAYQRVQVDVNAVHNDDELHLRFLWMGTKLTLEAGEPDETKEWADRFESFVVGVPEGTFDEELIGEARSSVLLTLADSYFAIDDPEEAIKVLNTLREEYAQFEPAKYSYIIEARYLSRENRTVEAQQLLQYLADTYSESRLAPMALYEAALNAERRGQDQMLEQAGKLLRRIIEDYPDSEMVFHAYLKQGDLLRKLNQFGAAEQIYDNLEKNYPGHRELYKAQISLADAYVAQSLENPAKFDTAISRLELLFDLESTPLNLRVEAGYKLGSAWRNQGESLKAKQAFWTLYNLLDVSESRIRSLDMKGRYWFSRTLFALGEIEREELRMDASRAFYERIVALNLPGAELAKPRIERLEGEAAN